MAWACVGGIKRARKCFRYLTDAESIYYVAVNRRSTCTWKTFV
ncbi:hypothetical protein HMPREF1155_0570 [Slackia sp. CM382]|nr:hypothetical protein HMPREF1155_0570 [Slackia sp. CM382]